MWKDSQETGKSSFPGGGREEEDRLKQGWEQDFPLCASLYFQFLNPVIVLLHLSFQIFVKKEEYEWYHNVILKRPNKIVLFQVF